MSQQMMFLCLPDVQRQCRCDLIARLTKTDCGVVLPDALTTPPPTSKKGPKR